MDAEREKELLGLIEAYWRIRGFFPRQDALSDPTHRYVSVYETDRMEEDGFPVDAPSASWAESEACRREVAGECATREADIEWLTEGVRIWPSEEGDSVEADDKSNTVALLRAFVSAFGGKEPR